ncbi:cytochrome P450 [bacterium]|nr:cytochrome P450 [bacterium]
MSEVDSRSATPNDAPVQMPSAEGAQSKGQIPSAYDLPLADIMPISPRLFRENRWQEYFERLRAEDPVHFNETDMAGRFWSLTRYDDIKRVDTDWQHFTSSKGITLGFPVDAELPEGMLELSTFIAQDPPIHDVQRKTVAGAAAPGNLANMEALIRQRTGQVLDQLPENETFDWVDTVSIELTTMMLATLFDFPFEDRRKLTRWSDVTFAVPQPGGIVESIEQRRDELLECLAYFNQLREQRKGIPGNDLVSMLANGDDTKDMPPMEYLGNLLLLIVGGNDTTRNTMSGSVYGLNKFPEQFAKLVKNPGLIPQMVAEIIRWQTPLAYMRRTANQDCEIRGKQIKQGDQLLMWYVSGNRDQDVFDNADQIDIERHNARQHLSFGFGIHRCMGNRLAELQLKILWEEILQRFQTIEVQAEPERTLSSFVKGYTHLPVQITRKH